jgi:hypothetical protein
MVNDFYEKCGTIREGGRREMKNVAQGFNSKLACNRQNSINLVFIIPHAKHYSLKCIFQQILIFVSLNQYPNTPGSSPKFATNNKL